MIFNSSKIAEELVSTTEKIAKGYKVLEDIGDVEVGATPKELVWSCDKIKMYHYTREMPAKCATPVLVSVATIESNSDHVGNWCPARK